MGIDIEQHRNDSDCDSDADPDSDADSEGSWFMALFSGQNPD